MKNEECDIVKDLLPSYVEELTSDASNKFLNDHLKTCDNCKKLVEEIKENAKEEIKENNLINKIDFFKKIKNVKKRSIIFLCLSVIILIFSMISIYYNTGLPLNINELEVVYVRPDIIEKNNKDIGNMEQIEVLQYEIKYNKENQYITGGYIYNLGDDEITIKVYSKIGDGGKTITGPMEIRGVNKVYIEGGFGEKILIWERK